MSTSELKSQKWSNCLSTQRHGDLLKNGESIDLWDLMNTNGKVQIGYSHCKHSTMDYGS
jgi:hypothetical protein